MVKVDVLVIGTGTAGYTLALALSKAGRQVAVVDNRPYGGTCAMRGCQPKKYLVAAAEVAHLSHQMSRIGIKPVALIDWAALMKSKSAFTDAVPERTEKVFQKAGIEQLHGTARFISPDEVAIGPDLIIRGIPSVLFTQPPLALVGMTEDEAEASGIRFRINRGSMSDWPSSLRIGQKHAYYKVIIEEESGHILGAHLFGHNAGEVINIFALAIKFGLRNQDLKQVLWAYPTTVSDLNYMID
jgi:pyruvate/2-oxoglutarate dehydrogenase complex dihydrolipoamide dehydrogenase (E3) component